MIAFLSPGLVNGLSASGHLLALHRVQLLRGRIVAPGETEPLDGCHVRTLRVDAGQQRARERREARPVRLLRDPRRLALVHPPPKPGQPRGQARYEVCLRHPHRRHLKQLLHPDRRLAIQRRRDRLVALAYADRIDDHEVRLVFRVRGDLPEVAWLHDAHAAPLHLLEVARGVHVAHEQKALQRFHVRAGRDHVHRDGDARVVGVAEVAQQVLRRDAGRLRRDLPAELVALAELLS